jgi:hypothetical protein
VSRACRLIMGILTHSISPKLSLLLGMGSSSFG